MRKEKRLNTGVSNLHILPQIPYQVIRAILFIGLLSFNLICNINLLASLRNIDVYIICYIRELIVRCVYWPTVLIEPPNRIARAYCLDEFIYMYRV